MDYFDLALTVVAMTALFFVAALVIRGRPWPLWYGPILGVVLALVQLGILHPVGTMSTYDPDQLIWILNWQYPIAMLVAGTLPMILIKIGWLWVPKDVLERLHPLRLAEQEASDDPEAVDP